MDKEFINKAIESAPMLFISLGAVLLMFRWALNFLRDERTADGTRIAELTAQVGKLNTTVAEFGGRVIEAANNSTNALRELMEREK